MIPLNNHLTFVGLSAAWNATPSNAGGAVPTFAGEYDVTTNDQIINGYGPPGGSGIWATNRDGTAAWNYTETQIRNDIYALYTPATPAGTTVYGLLPGGERVLVMHIETSGGTVFHYWILYDVSGGSPSAPLIIRKSMFGAPFIIGTSTGGFVDLAGAKGATDTMIAAFGDSAGEMYVFALPSISQFAVLNGTTAAEQNYWTMSSQGVGTHFGNAQTNYNANIPVGWCLPRGAARHLFFYINRGIFEANEIAGGNQNAYLSGLYAGGTRGCVLRWTIPALADPPVVPLASLGTPTDVSADFVDTNSAPVLPFTDEWENLTGTPFVNGQSYAPKPSVQFLASNQYLLTFSMMFWDATNAPIGSYTKVRVFSYDPGTGIFIQFTTAQGAMIDPVALGQESLPNRNASTWINQGTWIDPLTSALWWSGGPKNATGATTGINVAQFGQFSGPTSGPMSSIIGKRTA